MTCEAACRQFFAEINPQSNPQFAMSCMTCAAFGSPRMLVSCCNTYSRSAVTAKAAGSSPVVPAIHSKRVALIPFFFRRSELFSVTHVTPWCVRE